MTKPTTLTGSPNITQLFDSAARRLTAAGSDTPRLDAEILLAHLLDRDRTWLYLHPQASLSLEQQHCYLNLIARREQREPVAYLTGHKEFFGLEFLVTPATLIPRPETELLVETALSMASRYNELSDPSSVTSEQTSTLQPSDPPTVYRRTVPFTIVDVGTGSGCIAVTLAKLLQPVELIAVDLSAQALNVARQNAGRHGVAGQIEFCQGNVLDPVSRPVEMIVSNPPYVRRDDLVTPYTSPEVHRHEPRLALDGGPDGLKIIRRLLTQAQKLLVRGGCLLIEIGFDQGAAVKALAQAQFPKAQIEIKKDFAGQDRLLVVTT